MKICVVGLRGIPEVMGGVETHCTQLFRAINRIVPNADITVLARRPYVGSICYSYGRVLVRPLWSPRHKYFETIVHTPLAILYSRVWLMPELLHIHSIGAGLFAPLARLLCIKVVVTHHGEDFRRSKWGWLAKAILRLGEFMSVIFAHNVIVVSRSLTNRLKARFPHRSYKIHYIPNGVPPIDVSLAYTDERSLLDQFDLRSKQYVISVGRLVPEKGFQDLVSAFGESNTDLKLVIVGASDHEDTFSRSLVSTAGKNVIFTGALFGADLWTLYRQSSLFVLASSHEGLPITALEALGLGIPVLLSDIEAHTDLELPSVCYFETGNTSQLAAKLLMPHSLFAVDPEQIRRRYDWSSIAEETLRIYGGFMIDP